jgi:hypothetical protein
MDLSLGLPSGMDLIIATVVYDVYSIAPIGLTRATIDCTHTQ